MPVGAWLASHGLSGYSSAVEMKKARHRVYPRRAIQSDCASVILDCIDLSQRAHWKALAVPNL